MLLRNIIICNYNIALPQRLMFREIKGNCLLFFSQCSLGCNVRQKSYRRCESVSNFMKELRKT